MQRSFRGIAIIATFLLSATVLTLGAYGQTAVADRILQPVDDASRITLKGNVPALAISRYDLGAAPASQTMSRVRLVLQRSNVQEAALENFLVSAQQPGSTNYHKWLTPEQFGKLYGPSDNDIQKLTGWLQSKGFTVNNVSTGRTLVEFTGSVTQVQNAFHTTIHSFQANGVSFVSNTVDPQIPAAFAGVVSGVAHLNTIPMKPMHVPGFSAKFDSKQGRIVPLTTNSRLHPSLTEQDENGNNYLVAVPGDVGTIYDAPNSAINANPPSGTSYTGAGAIIGVAGQTQVETSIIGTYRTLFLGNGNLPTVVNPTTPESPNDDVESYLDLEVSGAFAPSASIYFYSEAVADNGVVQAAEDAIAANIVDILSVSYGDCESDMGNASNAEINQDWQQASAQGITVVVASGDTGSAGCDASDATGTAAATGGLSVNGLGSTPYNISVGGTDYDTLANNFGQYVSTPGNGGSASTLYRTAKSYIPEDTWNDSPTTNGTVSENVPIPAGEGANITAGSGGKSSCVVQTAAGSGNGYVPPADCTSGYPKPSWQTGTGVPNDSARDVPDVSLLAADGAYAALWAVCDNQSDGNGGELNCSAADTSGDFENDAVGGTSASTPAYAGIFALIRQKTRGRLGLPGSTLYALFNGASASSIFHDITTGNNSVPCVPSTLNAASCLQNTAGNYFESGYDTNTGYDLATGLGSVDVTQLVNAWGSSATPITPTVTVTTASEEIAVTDPIPVTVTVTGPAESPTPTGSVTLTVGSYVSAATTLMSGSASITVPANTLTPGSYTASAAYTPDSASSGTYFSGSGTVAITVGGSFSLNTPTAVTVSAGASSGNTTTVTASTSNAYTGTVTFSCAIATEPAGANASYYPSCTPAGTITIASGQTSGSTTVSFGTTARSTSTAMAAPSEKSRPGRWYIPVGGAMLAGVFFFGIPARRRSWRALLSLLVFLVAMAGTGCGGGGGGSNNPPVTIGTTAGTYTFTLKGTDANSVSATTTLTLNVN
jgi:subtilase family serine protease